MYHFEMFDNIDNSWTIVEKIREKLASLRVLSYLVLDNASNLLPTSSLSSFRLRYELRNPSMLLDTAVPP